MVYKSSLLLNLLCVWDWSHGAKRDLDLMYSDIDQSHVVILSLVMANLRTGPDKQEGMRFEQISDAMKYLFSTFTAKDCKLFQCRAPDMLYELGDKVQPTGGESKT